MDYENQLKIISFVEKEGINWGISIKKLQNICKSFRIKLLLDAWMPYR